ncbi:MAG: hypothetical protein JNM57_07925 [Cyclobacteriaceae bacterium]|nr:hypothetical protein [Cyclobacteriaceae bacterium]
MKTNPITISLAICSLVAGLFSCDNTENPVIPSPDATALKNFVSLNINQRTQNFAVDAATGGQIKGNDGTIIKFYPNGFMTLSGEAVSGSVDIELIEIFDRASMLLVEKPTVGKMGNGDLATLISGGEFYVNATQGGLQLKPANGYTITAPTNKTGGPNMNMNLFNGVEVCENDICKNVWEEQNDRKIEVGEFQSTGGIYSAYYAFQNKFGWTNIDRWYNDPRTKTTLFVDVPEGFNNSNCALYMTYDGEKTALARFDKYDETTGLFTEHYGLIPVGLNVHFILVSIVDDEIHYAIQSATIKQNHVEVIDTVESITQEELVALIGNLP